MTDHVIGFLRSLHDDGWDDGLEALFCGIAEVEGRIQRYSEPQINGLAKELIRTVKYARKSSKAGSN